MSDNHIHIWEPEGTVSNMLSATCKCGYGIMVDPKKYDIRNGEIVSVQKDENA